MKLRKYPKAQNPLILRFRRLMDAFTKSDDERDFYLDTLEGFIVFADLDKNLEDFDSLIRALEKEKDRFHLIPKMTLYETKKFMEEFINDKVYDLDTREKLLDILQSKEAREHFLEFLYDHPIELEKWQQYYHERFRIRIIEWLRQQEIKFVFEEDVDISTSTLSEVKERMFDTGKASRDVVIAREMIAAKAKTYYSSEVLNPRPKRGRPPKQTVKEESEPRYVVDVYTTVPPALKPFLYLPDLTHTAVTFSSKFDTEAQLIANLRGGARVQANSKLELLSQRLASLGKIADRLRTSQLGIQGAEEGFSPSSGEKRFDAKRVGGEKVEGVVGQLLPNKEQTNRGKSAKIQKITRKKYRLKAKKIAPIERGTSEKGKRV